MILRSKQPQQRYSDAKPSTSDSSKRPALTNKTPNRKVKNKVRQENNHKEQAEISLYFDEKELSSVIRDSDFEDKENVVAQSPETPNEGFSHSESMTTSTPCPEVKKVTKNLLSYLRGGDAPKSSFNERTEADIRKFQQQNFKTYSGRAFTLLHKQRKRKKRKPQIAAEETDVDSEDEEVEEEENCVQSPKKKSKKNEKEEKQFEEWAKKMNQELELASNFELLVD